jgi:outer membrane receptor protein involved in Fe transport
VRNAGSAKISGAEQQLEWAPVQGLNLSLAATELDPKMSKDFCYDVDPATGQPLPATTCPVWDAVPKDTQLPTVPKFKGNATARYTFPVGGTMDGHVQASYAYQSKTNSTLSPYQNALIGSVDAGTLISALGWSAAPSQWICSRRTCWMSGPMSTASPSVRSSAARRPSSPG